MADKLEKITDTLVSCPAFVGIEHKALVALARHSKLHRITEATDPQSPALVVRRGGLIVRDARARSVDMVAPGEFTALSPGERVDPVEACQVVWLPEEAIDLAWSAPPSDLPARLITLNRPPIDLQTSPVRTLMRTPVHTAVPYEPAHGVAQRMTEARVSSIVVLDGSRIGIVTDRDLRSRLIAAGRSADLPIGEFATFPARTIHSWTPVFDALVEMLSSGAHHLPVVEDDGSVVGMVSSHDLLELGARSPLHVRAAIDRADDVGAVAAVLSELPEAVGGMLVAGTTPGDVGRVIATVTDRVQRRLLTLAFAEFGQPPTPYGWIAFGSQGRREQTLHSDQDHGLLLPDGVGDGIDPDIDAWWEKLAGWMVEALVRCGYAPCDGGVMAVNAPWRRSVSGWRGAFSSWIERPSPDHLLESTIAFDLRTVSGELQVRELLQPTIVKAAHRDLFLAHLARNTIKHRPPLGFFGRFAVKRSGKHNNAVDIKGGAMLPVADIARLFTLARGGNEISTDSRLSAAADDHLISDGLVSTLRTGYELAMGLRVRHHLDQHRRGEPQNNWLDLDDLEPLVRSQLRETFKAIRVVQQSLETRYHTSMLG